MTPGLNGVHYIRLCCVGLMRHKRRNLSLTFTITAILFSDLEKSDILEKEVYLSQNGAMDDKNHTKWCGELREIKLKLSVAVDEEVVAGCV